MFFILGFSEEECESQKNIMTAKLSALEEQAYTIVGHPFSLSAPDDIAQVCICYPFFRNRPTVLGVSFLSLL